MAITYTFPQDVAVPALRGITLADGQFRFVPGAGDRIAIGSESGNAVVFATDLIHGKTTLVIRLDGRPELLAAVRAEVEASEAARSEKLATEQAELEAAVPGITEILALADAAEYEAERYSSEFAAMMDDGDNDGVRPPYPENMTHGEMLTQRLAGNPRAALYLKAKLQADRAHWADNTGTGAAGRNAMEMLRAGAAIEDAEAALAGRREWTD